MAFFGPSTLPWLQDSRKPEEHLKKKLVIVSENRHYVPLDKQLEKLDMFNQKHRWGLDPSGYPTNEDFARYECASPTEIPLLVVEFGSRGGALGVEQTFFKLITALGERAELWNTLKSRVYKIRTISQPSDLPKVRIVGFEPKAYYVNCRNVKEQKSLELNNIYKPAGSAGLAAIMLLDDFPDPLCVSNPIVLAGYQCSPDNRDWRYSIYVCRISGSNNINIGVWCVCRQSDDKHIWPASTPLIRELCSV